MSMRICCFDELWLEIRTTNEALVLRLVNASAFMETLGKVVMLWGTI